MHIFVSYSPSRDVPDVPSLSATTSNVSVLLEGDDVTLSCSVDSHPISSIKLQNITTGPGEFLEIVDNGDNTGQYTFSTMQCLDTGPYQLTATNGIPDDSTIVTSDTYIDVMCKSTANNVLLDYSLVYVAV